MKIAAYLLIDDRGAIEVRKNPPAPHLRQVAIRLLIQIDDSWFKRAIPTAELIVPNDHVQPMAEVRTEPMPTDDKAGVVEDESEDEDDEPRDFVIESHYRIAHKNDDELPDHLA